MKTKIILSLCMLYHSLSAQISSGPFKESFTWDSVKALSKAQKKLIFIDLYASWCAPCKEMDKLVYTNDTVYKYLNENLISLKLKTDSTTSDKEEIKKMFPLAQEIVKKYNISSLPGFLFLDASGNLQHKAIGYHSPKEFIDMCQTAQNPNANFSYLLNKLFNNTLEGNALLDFTLTLKNVGEDSLSRIAAKKYKETILEKENTKRTISSKTLTFLSDFRSLFSINDQLVKHIFTHPEEADSIVNLKGFSNAIINYVTNKGIVNPYLKPNGVYIKSTPSWGHLEQQIAHTWDMNTAKRIILDAKLRWYDDHQEWDSLIKYQIIRIDQITTKFQLFEAFAINNFVFDIILKKTNKPQYLQKAQKYLEKIIAEYPENHEAIDTYANILYKSGKPKEAIKSEERALLIAQSKNVKENITLYKETIKKMESGQPTWE
ncbi:thioredoxin family protein [Chitinophaga oryzae]|uniref:Thioredoxin family protein n=1 Tax=Chitinophaga oryzae TaxID=2725414 RepID=A0AAE7D8C8_9BACT|nr:thioredoxin fold domain-containing protein [Chitinophaga oryzae]QJB32624.1 thioredoxin family protein [Chitinophaga oryzae]